MGVRGKVDRRHATLFSAGVSYFIVGDSLSVSKIKNSLQLSQQTTSWFVCFKERFSYSGLFSVALLLEVRATLVLSTF